MRSSSVVPVLVLSWSAALAVDGRAAHAETSKPKATASASARVAPPPPGASAAGSKGGGKHVSAAKMTHDEAAAMLKVAILQVESASRELDAIHEEGKRLNAQLHAANLQIQRGRQRILEGQRAQKLGRDMRRRGATEAGDAKIAAGQKAIDEGAREIDQGIAVVRTTQAELNALSARAARVREQADEGRRKAKVAEASM